jgi:hypothetical protein
MLLLEGTVVANGHGFELRAVSPSSTAVSQSLGAIGALLPTHLQPQRRIQALRPNHTSVALWAQFGTCHALLGADLEVTPDENTGWEAVLGSPVRPRARAGFFKVPHHGSENGHHDAIWSDLLEPDCPAALTPYRLGRHSLPTDDDLERLSALTPELYVAGRSEAKRHTMSPAVERTLREAGVTMRRAEGALGHVRASVSKDGWVVEAFGNASHVQRS